MFTRDALHGLRILVSCALELRSRYPSSKLPWLYEGRCMQVTVPGVFHRYKASSSLAVSEHPRRMPWSAVVMSHNRRERPSQTCGNDTVADFLMVSSSNFSPTRVPLRRWLHIASVCIGVTRGPHDCVSRGMADRPSSLGANDTRFLEGLRLCRECASHGQRARGKYMRKISCSMYNECLLVETCDRLKFPIHLINRAVANH